MPAKLLNHVILGDGVAGMSAAQLIRAKRPDDAVYIISNDPHPFYYRAALTNYLIGELSDEELWALPPDHWERLRLKRVYGQAASLDAANHMVHLADGKRVNYDRLLIATGARARTLETPDKDPKRGVAGANLPGVTVMRTLADTRRIVEAAARARHAVVLGGGILGLEVCHGLRSRNVPVTLVHKGSHVMERVVTQRAGELIQHRMRRDGVDIHLGSNIQQIVGSSGGIQAVMLEDGTKIACSLLVLSIGIVPNTEWLRGSGIEMARGFVPVDRRMRVAGVEDVWAAGDVTYFEDEGLPFANPGGLWQPSRKQGQVAGLGMAAEQAFNAPEYRPGVIYNATRAWDLDLGTLGDHVDGVGTTVTFEDRRDHKPIYKRLLIRDGHVVGGLLLGDRREGHALRHLMNLKGPQGDVTPIAERLLDPEFDLPAWVASRAGQPDAQRWKKSLMLPSGPLPPSVAAAAGKMTQAQIAFATPMNTMAAQAVRKQPITLRSPEGAQTFEGARVRIGRMPKCDILVDDPRIAEEEIILTLEGAVWVAISNRNRSPKAHHNQRSLARPEILENGDILSLGGWRAVVHLPRGAERAQEQQAESAVLIGAQEHAVSASVTSIGAGPDNDIVLTSPGVSLFHAQVQRVGSPAEFYVTDAGSETGTFVNGQRVYSPVRLSPGAILRIGSEELVFKTIAAPAAEPAQPSPPPAPKRDAAAPPAKRSVYLSAVEGPFSGQAFEVPIGGVVGRSGDADVTVRDGLLSRRHIRIDETGGGFTVTDLGALNGTLVDGQRIAPQQAVRVAEGTTIRIGRNDYRFCLSPPAEAAESAAPPADEDDDFLLKPVTGPRLEVENDGRRQTFDLGADSVIIGRDKQNDLPLDDAAVSRLHLKLQKWGESYSAVDLGSSHGTRVNGRRLGEKEQVGLADGDVIEIGNCKIKFRTPAGEKKSAPPQPSPAAKEQRGFRVDWASLGDPLTKDLRKTVLDELDSCIGCHDCMRACPLPDAPSVSIAALNAYGSGLGTPSTVAQRFVQECTQCQACVPVCPVDIQRSRIVLWNKLKQTPSPDQKVNVQVRDTYFVSQWTIEQLSDFFAKHTLMGALNGPERIALLGNARFRQLLPGEYLVRQGAYPDAMWIVIDGRLEVGMATAHAGFQQMVLLAAGQTVAETAVLSDQPSDVTARSLDRTLVLGLPKYALKSSTRRNSKFRQALDALYVSRSIEVFLRKLPALAGGSDEMLCELIEEFDAERYMPGNAILSAQEATTTFALVRRGFVKEVREVDGQELTANYLKEGDAFGGRSSGRRGLLLRYEAATLAEVFTIDLEHLQRLDSRWPGLSARLVPMTEVSRGAQAGLTQLYDTAANEGLLQATRLMVIDTRACVDCNNCVDACERRHGRARIDRSNAGLQVGPYQVPASCFHCDDPVCLLCAVDGIIREESGEIRIVPDNCIGCGACASRCPYDNIQMVPRGETKMPLLKRILPRPLFDLLGLGKDVAELEDYERVATKCDLCAGFSSGPACVRSCPTGAAQRVDPLKLFGH